MFYYLFGLFCIIILILAIFNKLPLINAVSNYDYNKHQNKLPLNVAFFVDQNIVDLKHIH